ncbi:hypothetical protein BRD09_07910 [Halobacteriales archaeon SW_10_68_16]|nr:MAG: hypothetical protein BRD09_07910 [Halobacteriales archaeon SW_10_68_16]
MRPRTRNLVLGILGVLVVLLALGAVPGLLKSGDPYYVTATAVDESTPPGENRTAVAVDDLPADRYPYTTAALAAATGDAPGRSDPYWRGPVGLKEAFTHSPFDELASLQQREPDAADGDAVYVRDNESLYRLAVTREDDD